MGWQQTLFDDIAPLMLIDKRMVRQKQHLNVYSPKGPLTLCKNLEKHGDQKVK